MDDLADEKKPFDHELAKDEDDSQPDPEEILNMDQGGGRVWSVKIPKNLMEKWQQVKEDNIHLATIRVYEKDPVTRKQRIFLSMPAGQGEDGEQYELEMQHEVVENQIVVAEREKTPGSRARTSILTGRIKHDCSLRPSFTKSYLQRLRERNMAYNTPTRRTKMFDPDEHGGRGRQNMLNSGAGDSSTFADMVTQKKKPAKGEFLRNARMPRNELLDTLFSLYREKARWSLRELKARSQQPEAWLKEVLNGIADLNRSGEFNGLYELKPDFRDSVKSGEIDGNDAMLLLKNTPGFQDMKGDDDAMDEDEDDDDDDDMEEVS